MLRSWFTSLMWKAMNLVGVIINLIVDIKLQFSHFQLHLNVYPHIWRVLPLVIAEKDMHYYQNCLEAILQNSPEAKIFCLIHKMDLVPETQREIVSKLGTFVHNLDGRYWCLLFSIIHFSLLQMFRDREEDLKKCSRPLKCICFRTSIWDETLYKVRWKNLPMNEIF